MPFLVILSKLYVKLPGKKQEKKNLPVFYVNLRENYLAKKDGFPTVYLCFKNIEIIFIF